MYVVGFVVEIFDDLKVIVFVIVEGLVIKLFCLVEVVKYMIYVVVGEDWDVMIEVLGVGMIGLMVD